VAYAGTIRNAIRYGYAVGRVRVLESELLTDATLQRLLDAEDLAEQRRVIVDTVYGSYLGEIRTGKDVEEGLDRFNTDLFRFLEEARLPEDVVRFFRRQEDYVNLRGMLKAQALGADVEELLVSHGTVDRESFERELEELPSDLREVAQEAMGPEGGIDADRVDVVVDHAMYRELVEHAEGSGSGYLLSLVRLMIDLSNLRTVVRSKRLGRAAAEVEEALVEGGEVDPGELMSLYPLEVEEMTARLTRLGPYRGTDPGEIARVERLDVVADNLLMRHARQARMVPTGMEPVIGYVIARHSEIVILRMLLLGKLSGLDKDALRDRMRELYA
jgi:V/A-type H+-transporting ATPase subunit C